MSGADELYPPAQYGWGWMLLAFAILLAVVGIAWLVIALTRPRTSIPDAAPAALPTLTADAATLLRREYLADINRIEAAIRSGALDARGAGLELSRTVRRFVNEYSGLEAPVLALDDLVRLGVHPALIRAVQHDYYPSVFRRDVPMDPLAGVESARQVVTTWY